MTCVLTACSAWDSSYGVCVQVSICLCLSVYSWIALASRSQTLHTMYCVSHRDDIDNDHRNNMAAALRILHQEQTGSAMSEINRAPLSLL